MTAFQSTSPDHQQSPHDRPAARHKDAEPSLWAREEWGQAGAEHSGPFLVFQWAVRISRAFQAMVKKCTLLILLSCLPGTPFLRIYPASSNSQDIFLWWRGRKGITLTPEPVFFRFRSPQPKKRTRHMVSTQEHLCLWIMLSLFKLLGEEKGRGSGRYWIGSFSADWYSA